MRNIFGNAVNTIADLKYFYKDSVPYSCKYRLELNLPFNIGVLDSYKLNIACQSIELPKASVKTQKINFRGRPLVLKGQLTFDESFKVTVQDNGHFEVRRELEKWIKACDSLDGNSKEDYKIEEVYLYHLDCNGIPTIKTVFYGVFLSELGGFQLADKSADVITYDCVFSYSTYESETL